MINSQFLIPNRSSDRRRALLVLTCCVLVLVLGCDEGIENYKPEPNVYCIIEAGRDTVSLMAGMTLSYFDSIPDSNRWNGTAGVVAKVQHHGAEVVLAELPGPVGFYRAESLPVMPGDSLSLWLEYPDGATVRGATTVPDTFSFSRLRVDTTYEVPWPGDTFAVIKLSTAWNVSRGASGYVVLSDIWYGDSAESVLVQYGPYPASGREDFLWMQPFSFQWDTLNQTMDSLPISRVRIGVRAIDRNYSDYNEQQWSGQADPGKMHLDGAVGVFGSACVAETTFRFGPASRDRSLPPRHKDTKSGPDGSAPCSLGGLGDLGGFIPVFWPGR
jgi:hypothetical protein